MKRCTILIVNWNGWADTIECLESLFRLQYSAFRVIVCDNGSDDGSLDRIRQWAEGSLNALVATNHPLRSYSWPPVPKPVDYVVYDRAQAEGGEDGTEQASLLLIDTGGNLGFAGGNNVGLRYLLTRNDCDFIWLLNNDTVVDSGALQGLVARMEEKPAAGMCGSTLLRYDAPDKVQARGGGWYCKWIGLPWHIGQLGGADSPVNLERIESWMNYVVGASLFVRRELLEKVGLLTEDYFLFFEELDLAMRSRNRFQLAYAPSSSVYHKVGRSIGTSSNPSKKSRICDYYVIRNRLLFTRRFHPEALVTIYLSVMTAMVLRLLAGNWSRGRMIWQLMTSRDSSSPISNNDVRSISDDSFRKR